MAEPTTTAAVGAALGAGLMAAIGIEPAPQAGGGPGVPEFPPICPHITRAPPPAPQAGGGPGVPE